MSEDKIKSMGVVNKDELSNSNFSLGKKRDKESRDSKKAEKPKTIKPRKKALNMQD